MKTGVDLIQQEREEQFTKHKRTIDTDVLQNNRGQLGTAASLLAQPTRPHQHECPLGWYPGLWQHMRIKPYFERLQIAGALIAAELDRQIYIQEKSKNKKLEK